MAQSGSGHDWTFFRAGEFDQVSLTTGADMMALDQLDQKLWAALACPVKGLHFDARTLELIDSDGDGRIRAPELIAAIKWAGGLLRSSDVLLGKYDAVPLEVIDDSNPDGAAMLSAARHVLVLLGRPEATEISVADTVEAAGRFAQLTFNGDGIITADAVAGDDALGSVIDDIIACLGADTDLSGKPGISRDKLDRFMTEAAAYSELERQAEKDKAILPLGDKTAAAAAAIDAVRAKVTDYFTRCRLAEFDPRAGSALNRDEKDYLALSVADLMPNAAEIAALPLSHVEAGKALALTEGVNPAWDAALERLRVDAIVPLLGDRTALTLDDWQTMLAKIAPFEAWNGAMAASALHALPVGRVREILAGKAGERLADLSTGTSSRRKRRRRFAPSTGWCATVAICTCCARTSSTSGTSTAARSPRSFRSADCLSISAAAASPCWSMTPRARRPWPAWPAPISSIAIACARVPGRSSRSSRPSPTATGTT
jgi:hypothetical protein